MNLSLDKSILDKNSKTAKRIVEYGDVADKYAIVVPNKDRKEMKLSEKVFVYDSGGCNKIFQLLNVYRVAKKLLKREKFNVVTVQDQYYLALIGWLLAKKFKIGLELQIHGFEKFSGLRKKIAKIVIPKANAIKCVSQRLKKQLVEEFGADEEKITVAPIYVESGKWKVESGNFDKKRGDKFVFLTAGRLALVKNIGLQIKAMTEVVKNYPNAELWIAGDGILSQKLKVESQNLGIENNVKFLGWQDSLEKFYSQADAFLLTSDYEGWGMVVVEAASCGLPIIMTDVGCAGELIENEKSGLVIPVNDQAKLQEAMIRFINDANLRKKLAEGAFSAIKKLPNKEETLALYRKSWEKANNNQ